MTVPWSLAKEGIPLSVKPIGKIDRDEDLLGVADWCEKYSEFDRDWSFETASESS